MPHALRYLGDMLAVGTPQTGAALLSGIVYGPYYFGTFLLAGDRHLDGAANVGLDQTLTLPKASATLALLVLAVVALTTQAFNPFIYFIF